MEIEFFGAARTVTGSQHMLSVNGYKILLDCGLYQGRREEASRINRNFHWNASQIDALILSHAHIDHAGNIPTLVNHGFTGKIYATPATRDLCAVMLADSAMIQQKDADHLLMHKGEHIRPLYTIDDVAAAMELFRGIPYRKIFTPVPGLTVTFFDAGHLLGSAITVLEWEEQGQKKKLCFTGDIGRPKRPILADPEPFGEVDYIISESTYGGRNHPPEGNTEKKLLAIIQDTLEKKGKLIIPAFSVGRTQEIIWYMNHLYNRGLMPHIPVYVDSPLAINATQVFRLHPECFDEQTRRMLYKDDDLFSFPGLRYIRDVAESKRINRSRKPCIVIAGSGMCESGRVLHHLIHNIGKPTTTILFLGYNAPYTLGRKIAEGEKIVRIMGDTYKVRAQIAELDGLSGHADHNGLLNYLTNTNISRVQQIFLVHGEPQAQKSLQESLLKAGFAGVSIPERGTKVQI
jgi:metallo-beta-lactamase family protein